MESNVNYTVVGAFVLVLISAIVVATLWLSAGFNSITYTPYRVYMNESVTGLSVGAPVKYNGVEVGNVKNIDLNARNPQQVILLLNIKSGTPITQDTTATLDSQGITGIAYLALRSKGTNTQPLQTLPGQPYPVIKTVPSIFVRLDTALSQLTTNFNQVSNNIAAVLNSENQQAFKNTLNNLNKFTGTLATDSQQLHGILQSSQTAISNLNNATNNISELSIEIKQNPSVLIRGKTPQPLGPGEQ
jgi:phospholipid/cholesterol/gamma-HCH transport system substrate-binding protein